MPLVDKLLYAVDNDNVGMMRRATSEPLDLPSAADPGYRVAAWLDRRPPAISKRPAGSLRVEGQD